VTVHGLSKRRHADVAARNAVLHGGNGDCTRCRRCRFHTAGRCRRGGEPTENVMGNTNIPQAGAENLDNGRDTLSGDAQSADTQRKERDAGKPRQAPPAPSRPKNAPPRIPGQNVEPDPSRQGDDASPAEDPQLPPDDPYNPRNTTGAGDPPSRSHIPSGYSAPDAT
jgi:hypothetical protein